MMLRVKNTFPAGKKTNTSYLLIFLRLPYQTPRLLCSSTMPPDTRVCLSLYSCRHSSLVRLSCAVLLLVSTRSS